MAEHDLSDPWPLREGSVKVAVLLDVLEHMTDPVQVLTNVAAVLEPGGGIILTVPAYPWLFGEWDESLGHFRRYTRNALIKQATATQLNVEWLSHWNSFSLPAAIAVRGYQRTAPGDRTPTFPRVPPLMNRMLVTMAGYERKWLSNRKAPFGLSLVGVLRK